MQANRQLWQEKVENQTYSVGPNFQKEIGKIFSRLYKADSGDTGIEPSNASEDVAPPAMGVEEEPDKEELDNVEEEEMKAGLIWPLRSHNDAIFLRDNRVADIWEINTAAINC